MRVLLADDDPAFLELLRLQVRRAVSVRDLELAETAAEAIDALQQLEPFDLLVVDYRFPDGDGVDVIRAARTAAQGSARSAPYILLLTGVHDAAVLRSALAAGANDFLLKPPRPAELTARVQAAASAADALRQMNERQAKLRRLAMTDPLLGLPNRRAIRREIRRKAGQLDRQGDPYAVVALDIDGFKQINDTYGHNAGDDVLRAVSRYALEALREADFLGRLGGDELIAVISGESIDELQHAIERLRLAMSSLPIHSVSLEGEPVSFHATVSVGPTIIDDASLGPDEALIRADGRLYHRKRRITAEARTHNEPA